MKNIVLFGGGNIAQAVAEGLINAKFKASNIFYIDRNLKNQKALKKLKIKNLTKYTSTKVDLFILAVKPKDAIDAYKQILNDFEDPKIVSFVAGIKSKKYLKFNQDIQFLRAMPNTSARFNLGITAIYNSSFSKNNLAKVSRLFKKIGIVMDLDNEAKIDTFTGIDRKSVV